MTYKKTPVVDGEIIDETWGNTVDKGVFDAYHQSGALYLADGATCEHVEDVDGNLIERHIKVADVLRNRTDLSYTDGELSSIRTRVYDTDGTTVLSDWTDTITYPGGVFKATRAVSV